LKITGIIEGSSKLFGLQKSLVHSFTSISNLESVNNVLTVQAVHMKVQMKATGQYFPVVPFIML